MPTHTLPVVQCDRGDVGVIVRVDSPANPAVLLNKGFYRISMGSGCYGSWALDFLPTPVLGSIIGADSSQIIYVPVDATPFQCLKLFASVNDGELSINPLRVWEMPGNDPRKYTLYPYT
jgi:hypothetical protein